MSQRTPRKVVIYVYDRASGNLGHIKTDAADK